MDISHKEPLIEKARINMKESGSEIFPFENWVLQIWSNDHNPPHFHVKCDGWDIRCSIDDGRILEVMARGIDDGIFEYTETNAPKWLSSQCSILPILTNRENAMLIWEQIHDD